MEARRQSSELRVSAGVLPTQSGKTTVAQPQLSATSGFARVRTLAAHDSFSGIDTPGIEALHGKALEAETAAFTKPNPNPSGAQLYARYAALCGAQQKLTRIATLAQNAEKKALGVEKTQLRALRQRCLSSLSKLGKAFEIQTPIFAEVVHGGSSWPTRWENGPKGRRYINSFKSSKQLSDSEKKAYFEKKLAGFRQRGGRLESDIIAPVKEDQFIDSVRYDYCLVEDGGFRAAPRREGDPDPGHMILAEGGAIFNDTPVSMAGELMVSRDNDGEVVAAFVACNSGHFKPYAEDLPRMLPVLQQLGIPKDKVIFIGGPNNPTSILPEIAKKFDLDSNGNPKNSIFRPWQRPVQDEFTAL
ncbi:MAG: hypothetical protein VYC39_08350 [Myxococcota bacterium]|nr:hypothetical protein [Myxococcota bacterium]